MAPAGPSAASTVSPDLYNPAAFSCRVILSPTRSNRRAAQSIPKTKPSSFGALDVSSQFRKLTDYFRLVEKECPLGGAQTNRSCRYVLADAFLQFWFLCINPYSTMIERGRNNKLFEHIRSILPDYVGRHVLESWFEGWLKEKAYVFLSQQSKYRDYTLRFECRSLNDIHR